MKQHILAWFTCVVLSLLPSCSSDSIPPEPAHYFGPPTWKSQYQRGIHSAKMDIKRGKLAWETQDGGECERWRIRWCFRKILAEKYGIEYRVRGHFGPSDNEARISGYQSVMDPYLSARLGADWNSRISAEAETFYRSHWHEVRRQFYIDEPGGDDYEDYVRQHPISAEERRSRNGMDKFYGYRDEDRQRKLPSAISRMSRSFWQSITGFFSSKS